MRKTTGILLLAIFFFALPSFSQNNSLPSNTNAARIYQNLGQLRSEEELIKKLKQAQNLPDCDFLEGITEIKINSFMGAFPSPQKMIEIGRLLVNKGKEEERRNKFSSALDFYVMTLKLAGDLSKHKSLLSLRVSLAIEGNTFPNLLEYVNNKKVSRANKKKLLKYMEEYNYERIPLIDFVREEHKQNAAIIKLCLTAKKQIDTIYFKRTRENYHKYGIEIYKLAAPLLDYYYNKVEVAVRLDSERKLDEYGVEIMGKVFPNIKNSCSPWDPINLTNEKLRRFIPFYLSNIEKEAIPKIAIWQIGPRLIDVKIIKAILKEYKEISRENQELIIKL